VIAFPLVAAGVSAVFSAMLLRQYARDHRIPQLAWGVSLAMFAVASLIVAYGTSQTWDASMYRMFWLFGVMLNVPWLAVGSIALLGHKRLTSLVLIAVLGASAYALIATFAARTCPAIVGSGGHTRCYTAQPAPSGSNVFGFKDIPRGKDVWATNVPGARRSIYKIGVLYSTVAYVIVVLIAVATSWRRKGKTPPPERRRSNLMIAAGVTIVAIGSTALSRIGQGAAFSVTLALGVTVMFFGFLIAGRTPRPAPDGTPPVAPPPSESPA
jgi:hypothetical protein